MKVNLYDFTITTSINPDNQFNIIVTGSIEVIYPIKPYSMGPIVKLVDFQYQDGTLNQEIISYTDTQSLFKEEKPEEVHILAASLKRTVRRIVQDRLQDVLDKISERPLHPTGKWKQTFGQFNIG